MSRGLRLAFLAAAAAVAAAVAQSSYAIGIKEAAAPFPERKFVLTLPSRMHLSSGSVGVQENGHVVPAVAVTAAGSSNPTEFGVVLVIDTSQSMKGKAIAGARKAARTFAARRNPNQQLAIVVFDGTPRVLLPFTTDSAAIARALAQPLPLTFGTHIYDAVGTAVDLLKRAKISPASIVVLSDGADTGSRLTEAGAARLARDASARIFPVGLRSRYFEQRPLRNLAIDSGGRYSEATSPVQLAGIYRSLGSQLANEYLISYRSLAGPGKRITVSVNVPKLGRASAVYVTPKLEVERRTGDRPYRPALLSRIWRSPLTMVLVSLLAAALVAFAVIALVLGPNRGSVRRRVAQFVSVAVNEDEKRPTSLLTERMLEGTERVLGRTRWWGRLKQELELAHIKLPAEQLVVLTFVVSFVTIWFVSALSGSVIAGLLIGLAIPFAVRSAIKRRLERQRRLFSDQLPDNLQVLASALRAGHSFVGALSVVVDDAPEPSRSEFRRVVADEQLGVPLEHALEVVVQRMKSRELEQVALVAALQRETGGNTAEVLDRVTDTIRERMELRRLVRTLTTQGRMSRWIVSILPVALLVLISLLNPGYMHVMYERTAGRVLLGFAAVMIVSGSLVIRRIINIKV